MLPPPDFESLIESIERGRRSSAPLLLLLGRMCGRLAGAPELGDLARQAINLLDPSRPNQATVSSDQIDPGEVQRAFLSAFPTRSALEQMLSYGYGFGKLAAAVARGDSLTAIIHHVVNLAAATNQLSPLLAAAVAYNPGNEALRALTKTQRSAAPSADVIDEFRARFRELSGLERYSLLQTIYRRIPVPAFYQELARLVKAGYARHMLTTNIDTLFEQALESVGLVRDVDFDVVLLGTQSSRKNLSELGDGAKTPLLLKLHGDIGQGEFGVTTDEIDYAVNTAKRFIRSELESGIVIVGYEGESQPLNSWLTRTPGEIWWVSPDPPQAVATANPRWLQLKPPDFLAFLAARLLTLRAPAAGAPSFSSVQRNEKPGTPPPGGRPERPTEQALLVQEIDRLKSEAYGLGQIPPGTGTAVQRQEQIAQRWSRIRELEDQLRELPETRQTILELLDRVHQSVTEAEQRTHEVDQATKQYFAGQINTVREQYSGGQPNAHVVSAALGAALVVAERLGPSVIDPLDVQALAAYGPTIGGRS